MISFYSKDFENIIHSSATLRGAGRFQDAINLVESKISELDEECYLNAYKEIFEAYKELGNMTKASEYAKKLFAIEPNLPSIQSFIEA